MRYAIFLLLIVAFTIGCAQEQQAATPQIPPANPDYIPEEQPESPREPVVQEPMDDEETETARATADRIFGSDEVPTSSVPAEVRTMRERAEEMTVNGYSFIYTSRVDGMPGTALFEGTTISVRDGVVVSDLERLRPIPETTRRANYLGVRADGQEVAWCSSCGDGPFVTNQGLADLPLPLAWLHYVEDIDVRGQQRVDGRNAMRITGEIDDMPVELFVDEFSGVPLRVSWQGTEHIYSRLAFGVQSQEVAIP